MKRRYTTNVLIGIIVSLAIAVVGGIIYIDASTYRPSQSAILASESAESRENYIHFKGDKEKPAVIFYQGALVETESYSVWAKKVSEAGYPVYLITHPFNLPVIDQNLAQEIINKEKIDSYVIGGHSLGGVMASRFAARINSSDHLKGVFFLASYPDEKGRLNNIPYHVLSITADKDGVINQKSLSDSKRFLPNQTKNVEITGGNHAGFGSYGEQKGDSPATISNIQQQDEVSVALVQWLEIISE